MSVISSFTRGYLPAKRNGLPADITEKVEGSLQLFASRVKHYAAQHQLREADLQLFSAETLFVVRDFTDYIFVFVSWEMPVNDEVIFQDWRGDVIPSLEYVANAVTFEGGDAVHTFTLSEDTLEGVDKFVAVDSAANAYIKAVVATRKSEEVAGHRTRGNALKSKSKRIFIVHGHDAEMKEATARVLERLGLEPVILSEQPVKGRTLIEKFEANSDVGFVVVLLSPDDMAYQKSGPAASARPRPRQNVIFELGFFVGRLGRERVLVVHRTAQSFEMLSDYVGVEYKPYDDRKGWAGELVKELRSAGYDVSADRLP
jgi:predicted nucleotide-binding protein